MSDLLKILEQHPEVRDWIVHDVKEVRDEAYLIQDGEGGVDIERLSRVKDVFTSVIVYYQHDDGKLGHSSVKLTANEPIGDQIDDLVAKARTVANPDWTLPEPEEFEPVVTADENLTQKPYDCITDLIDAVRTTVPADVEFNNTEIFVVSTETTTRTSKGFSGTQKGSGMYFEVALSHTNEGKSDEVLRHVTTTSFDELDIQEFIQDAAEDARNITDVRLPEAGQYMVIIRADVISQLFHSLISKTHGYNEYSDLPNLKAGDKLVEDPQGDTVTLTLDPALPMGAGSTAYDTTGQLCERIELVVDNQVRAQRLDKKYADYLGRTPNGGEGNIVMEPGSMSYEEMQRFDGPVMEIIEFSALFDNALDGTFSSEIRLAKVYDGDEAYYVKGGSLAGNMTDALAHAYLSKETTKHTGHGGYVGPAYMLFETTISSNA